MPRPGHRVLLLGGDADYNIGDRAILLALVSCIANHDRAAEIAVVGDPYVNHGLPGVTKVISRGTKGIRELMRASWQADRVVIAGGGLFQDDDSRAKMPYWAARIALSGHATLESRRFRSARAHCAT